MHNLDWSRFTWLDHLIAIASLAFYVTLVAAFLTAPFWLPGFLKGGR
ncbi:hypothetical protein [Xanthomonas arboricola]|nr:hypothetical protein [Xanthomonas arboricola]